MGIWTHHDVRLQSSGVYLVFNLPLPKLYANSLLSSLNSRTGLGYGRSLGDVVETAMTSPIYARGGGTQRDTMADTQVCRDWAFLAASGGLRQSFSRYLWRAKRWKYWSGTTRRPQQKSQLHE